MADKVIVVGGGLAGLSSAHTVLEHGGRVLLLDKMPFCGGNSTKATSGINGSGTQAQATKNIPDSAKKFEEDTTTSYYGGKTGPTPPLVKVLTHQSGPAVDWLVERFGLDLSLVSQLGGHSFPRTHRGGERFPGMTITMALMEKLQDISKSQPDLARIVNKAKVTKLVKDAAGAVVGVEYEKDGQTHTEHGPVIIATGGFAADFNEDSILMKVRPDLKALPTTNGEHCTGDGIKVAQQVGAGTIDMAHVQVHPTGLVDPAEPEAKVLFLAAEALRGVGGILLDRNGKRFVNELGRRDYVTGEMNKNQGPFRLVLNGAASKEIEWHCKHYCGRGLMRRFESGADIAKDMGISPGVLQETFAAYNAVAKQGKDQYGKQYFHNLPLKMDDFFHVAFVKPVIHYCMGGLDITPEAEVKAEAGGAPVPGLYAAGEVAGGIHGINRLGGNSLLDCVVYGRVAGRTASRHLLATNLASAGQRRIGAIAGHIAPANGMSVSVDQQTGRVTVDIAFGQGGAVSGAVPASAPAAEAAAPAAAAPAAKKSYTMEEVAKHNTKDDCWVVVNGQVLDATSFLPDHPGGKKAILLYAGKDATEEFNMLHKPDVVEKYAPEIVLGDLQK